MAHELARQALHLVVGLFLVVLSLFLSQGQFILALFVMALLTLGATKTSLKDTFLVRVLVRDEELFAARGAYLMLLGAFFSALLFPEQLIYSLLVLALADSASTVVGRYFGRHPIKGGPCTYEGSAAFLVISAAILYPLGAAGFLIAVILTVVESFDYHGNVFLDDNVLLPLLCGLLVFMISVL